eukprot:8876621-Pyramimonas_sp.AAC.1
MFLTRVVSITTDFGAERLLSACPDVLIEFGGHVGIRVPRNVSRHERWFPFAVVAPGWMHIVGTVIERGLSSLEWFPSFLT